MEQEQCACRTIRDVFCPCMSHYLTMSKKERDEIDQKMKDAGITNFEISMAQDVRSIN